MNIASDPKSVPPTSTLSPEAAALAVATGVLTVDLDAICANWRKLEKTAVPAECAGVIKADAYGCGIVPVAHALANAGCKTFFVATLDEARVAHEAVPSAAIYVLDGFFQNCGEAFAKIDARPVIGDLNELAEWDVFCRRTGWAGGAARGGRSGRGPGRARLSGPDPRGPAPDRSRARSGTSRGAACS